MTGPARPLSALVAFADNPAMNKFGWYQFGWVETHPTPLTGSWFDKLTTNGGATTGVGKGTSLRLVTLVVQRSA